MGSCSGWFVGNWEVITKWANAHRQEALLAMADGTRAKPREQNGFTF